MQFERQQFSLYSFIIKRLRFVLWSVLIVSVSIVLVSTSLRLWYWSTPETGYLTRCLDTYFQRYKPQKQFLLEHQLLRIEIVTDELDPLFNETDCSVKQNESHNNTESILHFYEEISLYYLSQATRRSHKVQQIYIAVAMSKIAHPRITDYFGLEPILIDKLSREFMRRGINSTHLRDFSNYHNNIHLTSTKHSSIFTAILSKVVNICLSFYRFLIASIFCGVLVISLNVFLSSLCIPIMEICKRREVAQLASGELGENHQTSSIMFIEEHLHMFRNSVHVRHSSLAKYIIIAFVGTVFIILVGTQGFLDLATDIIIGAYYNRVNFITIVMMCVLEELSLVLFRTRTSIKYGPGIIILIYCVGNYLNAAQPYALPQYPMYGAFWLSVCVIMCLALFIELPVAGCSDESTYKPTANRPRAYYFPSYNIGWHSAPAPLWSYFVPQHPREFFSEIELSYVDRNYDLLYSQLMGLPNNPAAGSAAPAAQLEPEQFMMI